MHSLVLPLFDGPIDIVGDVHGEIDALMALLRHLGYDDQGRHSQRRRLVFVGDLTDRGPDSPAVVDFVQQLVETDRAQCILGNHELNILLHREKTENKWYFGKTFIDKDVVVPQKLADESIRRRVKNFFSTLPLALERNDVRVVHACWQLDAINVVRAATCVEDLYEQYKRRIDADLASRRDLDDIGQRLEQQNQNPVKVLTSGPERRAERPFVASGKERQEERVPWWETYTDAQPVCVFGHYAIPADKKRGKGPAFCVDFAIAKRWEERREGRKEFTTKLAALRLPEKRVMFDDGTQAATFEA